MDPFEQLEDWAAPLLAKLQPAAQRALLRQVARELRASQAQRIARQQNPDGTAFEPRKPQRDTRKGSTKARAMFGKIRLVKHLRTLPEPEGAAVGFTGRAARIAQVHQDGLRDRVSRTGPEAQYPERKLLGFSEADIDRVRTTLLNALAA
ncbi:MAG: phage virion morphogenesis protein [Hydrogenophaga sp.]|uniref:phage virion morphogenesis protein n=1 Tax=Hydrogenophaga sp. TaxID=1904254 RepID=UPI00271E754B|nr:phage virion morphogenesis protein [Hydrogenophaga sp.]MDO9571181.1 phage virion morphogenesis protein [Hydrogenophaga sp.]